ncbi:hypothetical protein HIM_00442 [Hirsutella minnesotensis 3608]|nr:hypothetical protein HIM_00442 [Hirsutella minnesotensis 3608]
MASSPAPGTDASRPRSGILTPTSEGSLSRDNGSCDAVAGRDGERKKTNASPMDHLLQPSIAIKPYPPRLQVLPRILLPLMLLPREHLPLACIDFSATEQGGPASRFFESHVKVLDLESRLGSAPSVLIARSDAKGTVHALERQGNGLYVVCQLGPWVDLSSLALKATAVSHQRLRPAKPERGALEAVSALTTPQLHKVAKRKREAIEAMQQSLVRKRARSQSVSALEESRPNTSGAEPEASHPQLPTPVTDSRQQSDSNPAQTPPAAKQMQAHDSTPNVAPQDTAEAILNNIRAQYFEALYKSMGSLAYFAKGPLARARSAFHLDLESNLNIADLIDFLKSLVLTTVQIDKKYRETVPAIISKMKGGVESSDEGTKRKRKSKKMKIGKDGLYPAECESIRKWWTTNMPELADGHTCHSASQIKSHVSLLRTRETQLQMIVILETLALEPLKAATDTGEPSLPPLPSPELTLEKQASNPPLPQKKRNRHNLPVLVDVHADRLTIWQSTASDEQLLLEDSQVTRTSMEGQGQQKASAEPLRDFCVDIIVPFFAARLPELCDSINRKLGGPVSAPPPKSKSSKRPSSTREQKPGSATKRPAPLNSKRTLQRALSTDQQHRRSVSRGPSNVIALLRSATSTSVTSIKREGSEPAPLRTLPKTELKIPPQKHPLQPRSSSLSNSEDARANKKALVEAELKEAISALRKPNRDVVGKAMAEADQRRVLTNASAKKKKTSRTALAPTVQVKATPANNRFRDVLATQAETLEDDPLGIAEDMIPPSSIGHLVPSTGSRTHRRDAFMNSASPALELVGGTPVRPWTQTSFLRRPANEMPAIPPSSPLMVSTRRTLAESSGNVLEPPGRSGSWRDAIAATPVKRGAPRPGLQESPAVLTETPPKKVSIYQQLGWDDDFDELE